MGNKITTKAIDLVILALSLAIFVYVGFPITQKAISGYRISYYQWQPKQPITTLTDTSQMPPAKAVPILMYHGVVEKKDEANTTIENFINQMTWLKQQGYETISINDYDLYRQGKLKLPPLPIIITFDDGRKDSYFTTDDVLRQLGYKATIFIATQKTIENEPFYLTWDNLRAMRDSGRWEIEAHGRRSHEKIAVNDKGIGDEFGQYGRYLTSRMWLPDKKRLETEQEFNARVEQDYINNINDLKDNLGVEAHYLAVPLNDYGQIPLASNPEAATLNHELVKKYFRMSFIEANSSDNIKSVQLPIYNYKNDDPYRLRRLEVKNMPTSTLAQLLGREKPVDPDLNLQVADAEKFLGASRLDYGYMSFNRGDGLILRTLSRNATAKINVGQPYWDNYSMSANVDLRAGRSVSIYLYAKDEKNYVSFGLTDNSLFIRQRRNGAETSLGAPILLASDKIKGPHEYKVVWNDGFLTAYFDGVPAYQKVYIGDAEGLAGVKVWGDRGVSEGLVRSLKISPTVSRAA